MVPVEHLGFMTIAEKGGEIAGFVTVIADATEGMAVLEERHAQAFGATHLWLVANARAQRFYEAHGRKSENRSGQR